MSDKRKPVNGVLNLTEEELNEFKKIIDDDVEKVYIEDLSIKHSVNEGWCNFVTILKNYKAILWLAERFDLTEVTE